MSIFGVVALGFVVYSRLSIDSPSGFYRVLEVVALLFGLACIVAPAAFAYRVSRAIRQGIVVRATAVEAQREGRYVNGRMRVEHPMGTFVSEFSEEPLVAEGIDVGTRLDVLVAPRRRKVLFVIGASPALQSTTFRPP